MSDSIDRSANIIPREYLTLNEDELISRAVDVKKELGESLVILGHHYQREEVMQLADLRGDSFGLSKAASEAADAKYIVFCGVQFMAESAEILAREDQTVQHPNKEAGCPMADMAEPDEVEEAWELIHDAGAAEVIPVCYMNSASEIKAFCGRNGGLVCTSSNAKKAFEWAFERGRTILFLPDEHLGRNTCNQMGITRDHTVLWLRGQPIEKQDAKAVRGAKVILWNGYCHVHTWFSPEHVRQVRKDHPEAKIVVHPECPEEVVALSDGVGSTEYIVRYVKEAEPGSTIAIGTELNLVKRLSVEHPDKKVFELSRSTCPNMHKINLKNVVWTLENIGQVNVVQVPQKTSDESLVALERMLSLS
jgi:quinolinate synthase